MAISSFSRSGLPVTVAGGAAQISGTPTGTYSSGGKDYAYFTFTGNGSLIVTKPGFIDYLIVGGGGGGGTGVGGVNNGGGGGAGGYRCSLSGENSGGGGSAEPQFYLSSGSYTVTVGAGGATDTVGQNSSIAGIVSVGGAKGATSAIAVMEAPLVVVLVVAYPLSAVSVLSLLRVTEEETAEDQTRPSVLVVVAVLVP